MATKFDSAMQKLSEVDGFLLANLVDKDSGMSMASAGGGMDIDLDSAVGTGVVKSIENAINRLDLGDFSLLRMPSTDWIWGILLMIR